MWTVGCCLNLNTNQVVGAFGVMGDNSLDKKPLNKFMMSQQNVAYVESALILEDPTIKLFPKGKDCYMPEKNVKLNEIHRWFSFFFPIHITFLISPVSHFFIPMRQIPHIILLESVGRDKFTWSNSLQSSNECLSLITHDAFLLPNYTPRLVYKLVRSYPTSRRAGPRSLMALRQVRFSAHKKICDEPGEVFVVWSGRVQH